MISQPCQRLMIMSIKAHLHTYCCMTIGEISGTGVTCAVFQTSTISARSGQCVGVTGDGDALITSQLQLLLLSRTCLHIFCLCRCISSLNSQKCLYALFGHFDIIYIFEKVKVRAIRKFKGRGNFCKIKGCKLPPKMWTLGEKRSGHLNYKFLRRHHALCYLNDIALRITAMSRYLHLHF